MTHRGAENQPGLANRGRSGLAAPGWSAAAELKAQRQQQRLVKVKIGEKTPVTRAPRSAAPHSELLLECSSEMIPKGKQQEQMHATQSNQEVESEQDEGVVIPVFGVTMDELANRFFGSEEEQEQQKNELLKRTKLEQKLFGYPKRYIEQETSRLGNGIRTLLNNRDKFFSACKDYERDVVVALDAAKNKLASLQDISDDARRKSSAYERELGELRSSDASLKGLIATLKSDLRKQKETEEALVLQRQDAEQQCRALEDEKSALEKRLAEHYDVLSQVEVEYAAADAKLSDMKKLVSEAEHSKANALAAAEAQHANEKEELTKVRNDLSLELAQAKQRVASGERQAEELRSEVSRLESKCSSLEKDCQRLVQEGMELKAQLVAVQMQASQKDDHLIKTLETFQQTQGFSQAQIQALNEQKSAVERQVSELLAAKASGDVEKTKLEALVREATEAGRASNERLLELSEKFHAASQRLAVLEAERGLQAEATEKSARESASQRVRADKLEQELTAERLAREEENKEHQAASVVAQERCAELEKAQFTLESEVAALKATYSSVSKDAQLERLCEVSKEHELLKRKVNNTEGMARELAQLRDKLKETEALLFEADKAKRSLHNEVQELKGKVRVIARVRPTRSSDTVLPAEMKCGLDGMSLSVDTEQSQSLGVEKKTHSFSFDRVFTPAVTQENVFDEVSGFVQSALDGYNVCLFSYGQTGSGKTFTMTGDRECSRKRGIIPRAVEQILNYQFELRTKGWEYSLEATYVEIYNETVRDLLSSSHGANKLEVRDSKKEIIVSGALRLPVSTKEDISTLLELAEKNRAVAATNSNAQSSRSHSVFTLFIKGSHTEFRAQVSGSLSMCDLAGSERVGRSGAEGERLKETQAINTSLSALACVFAALKKKEKHIPYRNSKLTFMLQPCFSGDGKTMMIVNLSPEEQDRGETICSLRFACQVNNTELGRAKKQIAPASGP